jgi:hypothetical protein
MGETKGMIGKIGGATYMDESTAVVRASEGAMKT